MVEIPKEAQQYLQQLQLQNQQLQSLLIQKQSVALQVAELTKALEELKKVKKEEIFKAVGPILIQTDKKGITKELENKKDTLDIQMNKLQEHEKKTRAILQSTQKKISGLIKVPEAN